MAPLATGESIVAIDFRPLTGGLYGLSVNGPNGQLVLINTTTGALTPIGSPFTISGASFGFDFNPSVDRIRVVSDTGLNLRLNPDTGAVLTDTPLAFLAGDVNQSVTPDVVASAYTNNVAGSATTSLFGLDFTLDVLVLQNPPNGGGLTTIGPLGQNVVSVAGFDIVGAGAQTGLAVMSLASTPNMSTVFRVNLQTGAATSLGVISSSESISGFAIDAPSFYGLTTTGALVRFNAQRPDLVLSTTSLTGMSSGERMVGIDYRPITGTLYGVGSTSRVYTINPQTGVCTAVGASAPTTLTGTVFGVDFNPTADRVRVTSDADQYLRLNPITGALVSSDPALNPANANIIEVAYTNNQTGLGLTTLLAIDSASDALVSVDGATGAVSAIGALGVDATGAGGFDIDLSNVGWAVLQVGAGATSSLFSVDLTTGLASPIGPTGLSLIGLTVIVEEVPQALVVTSTNAIIRFSAHSPQVFLQSALITGLMSSEVIVGLDARPVDGVLYAMTNQGRVYTLNPTNGVATLVSAAPFTITGSDFGFDFNPAVDRIRVTSNTGLNLRLNPATGALAATDTMFSFAVGDVNQAATPSITAVAYSENGAGVTRTTLYGIDGSLRALVRIGSLFGSPVSPNSGQVSTIAPLTLQGAFEISAFDIAPSGTAYLLRNNGMTNAEISVVNLANGSTRLTGGLFQTGFTVRAFTVLRGPP